MLSILLRWFPDRCFRVSADGNFATHRLACFAHCYHKRLTLVTRCYPDIALYAPPPAVIGKFNGRPRVKGEKLPSPQDVVKKAKRHTRLTVSWYGGQRRQIEVITGTGYWYRQGQGIVGIRWIFVHDLTGTHRDEYFFTTDTAMTPKAIVEAYTERWSIEVTFEESRAYLGFGTTRCRARKSVLRERAFPAIALFDRAAALHGAASRPATRDLHCVAWQRHRDVFRRDDWPTSVALAVMGFFDSRLSRGF
jgi:hypothetical protein